jgi:hypothetical protein
VDYINKLPSVQSAGIAAFKRFAYRQARSSFWRGDFEEAAVAAQEAVSRGDRRGQIILAMEAVSRCSYEAALSYCERLIANRVLLRDAVRLYWIAARATRQVEVIRRACDLIASSVGTGVAARAYVAGIRRGVSELCSVRGRSTDLPFLPEFPLPVVKGVAVRENEQAQNLTLMLDSGAESLCLSQRTAACLGLNAYKGRRGLFAGGRHAAIEHAILRQLSLGEIEFRDVPVTILARIPQLTQRQTVDGIIGSDIFKAGGATWDFAAGHLSLAPGRKGPPAGLVRMPARILGTHIVIVRGHLSKCINGWFFVDSGGTFGIAPDHAAWEIIRSNREVSGDVGTGGAGAVHYELATGDLFEMGGTQFRDVLMVGGAFPERLKKQVGVDLRGIVSHMILKEFGKFTIDYNEPSVSVAQ